MNAYCRLLAMTTVVFPAVLDAQVLTPEPTVEVQYDRSRDFSGLKTYDWMKTQKPAKNTANHIRITTAVQKELEALGFQPDTVKPDVLIQYVVQTRTKIDATSSQRGSEWDSANLTTDFIFHKENLGTLAIEMFDAETNTLVWRATTTQVLGTPDKAEKFINDVVQRLFQKYPRSPS